MTFRPATLIWKFRLFHLHVLATRCTGFEQPSAAPSPQPAKGRGFPRPAAIPLRATSPARRPLFEPVTPSPRKATEAIRSALEARGVEITNGDRAGRQAMPRREPAIGDHPSTRLWRRRGSTRSSRRSPIHRALGQRSLNSQDL